MKRRIRVKPLPEAPAVLGMDVGEGDFTAVEAHAAEGTCFDPSNAASLAVIRDFAASLSSQAPHPMLAYTSAAALDPYAPLRREVERSGRSSSDAASPFSLTVTVDRDIRSMRTRVQVCIHSAFSRSVGLPPSFCTEFSIPDETQEHPTIQREVLVAYARRVAQQFMDAAGAWPLALALHGRDDRQTLAAVQIIRSVMRDEARRRMAEHGAEVSGDNYAREPL